MNRLHKPHLIPEIRMPAALTSRSLRFTSVWSASTSMPPSLSLQIYSIPLRARMTKTYDWASTMRRRRYENCCVRLFESMQKNYRWSVSNSNALIWKWKRNTFMSLTLHPLAKQWQSISLCMHWLAVFFCLRLKAMRMAYFCVARNPVHPIFLISHRHGRNTWFKAT